MTRLPLRDLVLFGLLAIDSGLLNLNLWLLWRQPAANTTIAILASGIAIVVLVWTRELVNLWRAVLAAQLRKWDADAQVAEKVLAQMREIERAGPLTLPLQPPMPRH